MFNVLNALEMFDKLKLFFHVLQVYESRQKVTDGFE